MKDLPARKHNRLNNFDYSQNGVYFITICTKDMKCIFSQIVGRGDPDAPQIILSEKGKIIEKNIKIMNGVYDKIKIKKYVIMPNHIHMIIDIENGASRLPRPTVNISNHIGTLKRFCNKEIGENIWQTSFYDHIIRDEEDLYYHLQYIEENPRKWIMGKDEYYS